MNFLKGFTKEEKSWMMYDWANSAESVIIVTILPIFYDTISANSTAAINRWGYGTSLAMLVCALLAPLLGALGDFKGMRKSCFQASLRLVYWPVHCWHLHHRWMFLPLQAAKEQA